MNFTQKQITEIFDEIANGKNGYRLGRVLGHGGKLELRPRNNLYFNYLNYNNQIRRMIYTTNWIERLNRNYKRVLRMRSSMPNPDSVMFLLGSVASRRVEYTKPIYQFIYEPKLFY